MSSPCGGPGLNKEILIFSAPSTPSTKALSFSSISSAVLSLSLVGVNAISMFATFVK